MKKIFVYTLLSLIWFKYFTIIPRPIHVIPVPINTTEESSTSSDPSSNDASNSDPTGDGDGGDF